MNLLFFLFLCCPEKQGTHLWLSLSKMKANMRTVRVPASRGSGSPAGQGLWKFPGVTPLLVAPSLTALVQTFLHPLFAMEHLFCVGKLFRTTQTVLVNFFQNLHLAGNFVTFLPNWIVLLQWKHTMLFHFLDQRLQPLKICFVLCAPLSGVVCDPPSVLCKCIPLSQLFFVPSQ